MPPVITLQGIDQTIDNLNYRNPEGSKFRLLKAIRAYYGKMGSVELLQEIDADDLIKTLWAIDNDPVSQKNRRRNLSSLRSSINADLKKLYKNKKNPEGITISPFNTFVMSDEAKDSALEALQYTSTNGKASSLLKLKEILNNVKDLLPDPKALTDAESGENAEELRALKDLIRELSGKVGLGIPLEGGGPGVRGSEGQDVSRPFSGDEIGGGSDRGEYKGDSEKGQGKTFSSEGKEGGGEEIDPSRLSGERAIPIASGPHTGFEVGVGAGPLIEDGLPDPEECDDIEVLDEALETEEVGNLQDDVVEEADLEELLEEEELEDAEGETETIEEEILEGDAGDESGDGLPDPEEVESVEDIEEVEAAEDEGEVEEVPVAGEIAAIDETEVLEGEIEECEEVEDLEVLDEALEAEGEEAEGEEETVEEVLAGDAGDGAGDGLRDPEEVEPVEDIEEEEAAEDEGEVEEVPVAGEIEEIDETEVLEGEIEECEEEAGPAGDGKAGPERDLGLGVDQPAISEDFPEASLLIEAEEKGGLLEESDADLGEGGTDGERKEKKSRLLSEQFNRSLAAMDRFFNQYVLIPRGSYPVGNGKRQEDGRPERMIPLEAFYMGKFPVTNALYEVFIEKTGYRTTAEKEGYGTVYFARVQREIDEKTGLESLTWNSVLESKNVEEACWYQPLGPGSTLHRKRNHPVVQVSLEDATAFAAWTGKRLPTEEEWEAAARTDIGKLFPWGKEWKPEVCNIEDSLIGDTTPVDAYLTWENELGIADSLGNALEWTTSSWNSKQKEEKSCFVAKGGSWISQRPLSLTDRFKMEPAAHSNILGFRCVAY